MPKKLIKILSKPELKKLKRGGYSFRFEIPPYGGKGWTKSKWKKTQSTTKSGAKRDAEIYRQELENELNDYTIRGDITLGEYARNWHDNRKETEEIEELSWDREELEIKALEASNIADIPLENLTTEDIDEFAAENIKKKYSKDKQRRLLARLKQILKHALTRRKIKYDIAAPVENIKVKKKKRKALPEEAQRRLIEDLEKEEIDGRHAVIRIAISTGFRRGECLGLQWGDIDFNKRIINLQRQMTAKGQIKAPKYDSVGRVPIDRETAKYLKKWKKITSENFYDGGEVPLDSFVCRSETGGKLNASNFDRWRRRYFVDHGLGTFKKETITRDSKGQKRYHRTGYEGYNLHELRHTTATELLSGGADLKSVQTILRHKKMTTTEGYIHEIPQNLVDAVDALAEKRASND